MSDGGGVQARGGGSGLGGEQRSEVDDCGISS
jgi:hypothetical protein